MHWRRKWQPTPVFLPGESQGRRTAWWAAVYGVAQSRTRLTRLSSSSRYCGLPRLRWCEEPACQCRSCGRCGFDPWVRGIPWSRAWPPTPEFLPGESHGQRSRGLWSIGSQRAGTNWSDLARTRARTGCMAPDGREFWNDLNSKACCWEE